VRCNGNQNANSNAVPVSKLRSFLFLLLLDLVRSVKILSLPSRVRGGKERLIKLDE